MFCRNFRLIPDRFRGRCRSGNVPLQTFVNVHQQDSSGHTWILVRHIGDEIADDIVVAGLGSGHDGHGLAWRFSGGNVPLER